MPNAVITCKSNYYVQINNVSFSFLGVDQGNRRYKRKWCFLCWNCCNVVGTLDVDEVDEIDTGSLKV